MLTDATSITELGNEKDYGEKKNKSTAHALERERME